jgi:hypothetical protein
MDRLWRVGAFRDAQGMRFCILPQARTSVCRSRPGFVPANTGSLPSIRSSGGRETRRQPGRKELGASKPRARGQRGPGYDWGPDPRRGFFSYLAGATVAIQHLQGCCLAPPPQCRRRTLRLRRLPDPVPPVRHHRRRCRRRTRQHPRRRARHPAGGNPPPSPRTPAAPPTAPPMTAEAASTTGRPAHDQ